MSYHRLLICQILLVLNFSVAPFSYGANIATAEKRIEKASIYPKMLEEPMPQGIVDENSPWLHFRIPMQEDKKGTAGELCHRLYYFELSQDSTFKTNVIKSKAKRWSFYNPYQVLAKGSWFWKFGCALDRTPNNIKWSEKVYSFVISGNERKVVYPTPKQLAEKIAKTQGPHVVMLREDIGKLLPKSEPKLAQEMLAGFQKMLINPKPVKVIIDTTSYPKHLVGEQIRRYFTLKTLDQFTVLADRIRNLLNAYLLTGDVRYKQLGLSEFYDLDREYHTIMMKFGKKPNTPDDFVLEQHIKTINLILDAFADDLTVDRRNELIELLFKIKKEGYLNFYKQLEFAEHTVYKAHLWQMGVYTLLTSSIVLSPYKAEAKLWMEYAYELWLYRNPAASRTDGGWHEGNGYFGVNERQLTFIPIFLGKLMNYNYFNHPWYQNVAKYLSYSSPYGNPGLAFADGVGYNGCMQPNLVEVLGSIFPENQWNLWRMKTKDQSGEKQIFKSSSESSWSLLSTWSRYSKPNYNTAKAPQDKAAVFPDVGYVGMHTNFENPAQNLMVNFSSCPFGQLNHAHPSQNAFNIAYGSEPLFWRTGHYGTAAEHSAECFKHTRAHNCILADGQGQTCDVSGYGWIPRFVTGNRISYSLGDASHAYYRSGPDTVNDPKVTRFRRHIARLEPNFIVVYDELEAKMPVSWTFRLNAIFNMTKESDNAILTTNKFAEARAYLYCQQAVKTQITDKFKAEAIDVQGKRKDGKDRYPNHWHASMITENKYKTMRFLSVIEVTPNGSKRFFSQSDVDRDDNLVTMKVGGYTLRAQLNSETPSFLEIKAIDGECGLVTGQSSESITLNDKLYKAKLKGSTLFVEKSDKGEVFSEIVDQFPDALIYGNLY